MTDTEKKIAEMLDLSKPVSDCPECGGLGEIRSLGSRRKCECLYIRLKTLKRELDRRDEENRKLREERDAAVEGYQQQVKYAGELMTKLVSAQQERNMYKSSSEVFYERLKKETEQRQKLIEVLREIDTHIRSTPEPVQHIVETLKRVLPEYREGVTVE